MKDATSFHGVSGVILITTRRSYQLRHCSMLKRTLRPAMLAALFSVIACGPFHRGNGVPDPVIVFMNDSPDQAAVYAVSSGSPVRIGTVESGRRETLRVPQTALGGSHSVEIVARIFASNRVVRSGQITLDPGDSIDIRLQADEKLLSVLPSASP